MQQMTNDAQIYAAARSQNLQQAQLIEYIIKGVPSTGSTQANFTFPDQPNLRYVFLQRITVYTASDMPLSPISGTALITATQLGYLFLNLYANQKNALDKFPLLNFHNTNNSQPYFWEPRVFNSHAVTWSKTNVVFSQALGNTTDVAVLLCVEFIDPINLITPETQLQFANQRG